MANIKETVTYVHHWNDSLFSFRTTRKPAYRFKNGHFVMLGLEVDNKPLMRAYSIASANWEEQLEFFSIKVQDGPLTSRLQHLTVGDSVLLSEKSTGTLVTDYLLPGKNLWLISTGTGLAPFMSIIKDPEIYDQFSQVLLTHGVRYVSELAYADYIQNKLPDNEFFGDRVREQLRYYPTVTREPYKNQGRLTDLIKIGKLAYDLGMPALSVQDDRFMICGSPSMLKETCAILDKMGFREGTKKEQGHYTIERAFVEQM